MAQKEKTLSCFEQSNETSGPMKSGEFVGLLRSYTYLENGSKLLCGVQLCT